MVLLTPYGRANTGGGLFLNSRDMAKFGQLFLDQGDWQEQAVISHSWVGLSTSSIVDISILGGFRKNYGYLWWLHDFTSQGGQLPVFHAEGNGGQYIYIIPLLNTVVVFTGKNYNSIDMKQPKTLMSNFIIPAID